MLNTKKKKTVADIFKCLQEQYYVEVPFPLEYRIIEEAVASFFKFLEAQEFIKTKIDFSIAPQHRRGDIGYRHRHASDHIYNDDKEFFHYHLAIAESCPGLRIGSCPENLQLVPHTKENAIFMLASNFKSIMNTDDFSAGWHDVVQLEETYIGKPFSRWAVVAFIEAHGVKALPRTETHKYFSGVEI